MADGTQHLYRAGPRPASASDLPAFRCAGRLARDRPHLPAVSELIGSCIPGGITSDTMQGMAMTLRLTVDETDALRLQAEREGRSMQEVAREAVRDYVERKSRRELLDRVLDRELPRYAEALERLGR